MATGMDRIRDRMTEYLADCGVNAISAWPRGDRQATTEAVVSVSLRACQAGPAGYQDYLGERVCEETGQWEEVYGRKAKMTFGLDIYALSDGGEEAIETAFDRLAEAFAKGGPEGMAVEELSCGETDYDKSGRRLKRAVKVMCSAYLYAVAKPGGAFYDFEIKGGVKG